MRAAFQIRQATPDDVPSLLPMVAEYWAFEGITGFKSPRVGSSLSRLLAEPRTGIGWIGLLDQVPIGYLLAVYAFSLEHLGMTAEIDELYVLPGKRGRGVGRALVEAAELEFVRAGCTNVSLQLSRGNAAARVFYHRHGYVERSAYELIDKALDAVRS